MKRNCWYVAGWSHDIDEGELLGLTIIGEPIAIFKDSQGEPVNTSADLGSNLVRGIIRDPIEKETQAFSEAAE